MLTTTFVKVSGNLHVAKTNHQSCFLVLPIETLSLSLSVTISKLPDFQGTTLWPSPPPAIWPSPPPATQTCHSFPVSFGRGGLLLLSDWSLSSQISPSGCSSHLVVLYHHRADDCRVLSFTLTSPMSLWFTHSYVLFITITFLINKQTKITCLKSNFVLPVQCLLHTNPVTISLVSVTLTSLLDLLKPRTLKSSLALPFLFATLSKHAANVISVPFWSYLPSEYFKKHFYYNGLRSQSASVY